MKTNKPAAIIFILLVFGFVVGCAVASHYTVLDDYSIYENRMLATEPDREKWSLLNGTYFDDYETWLVDRSAVRTPALKLKTRADLDLFRRPVVNDVVVGKSRKLLLSWLDYETVQEDSYRNAADAMGEKAAAVNDAVTSYGGTFLWTIVPNQYVCYAGEYRSYLNNREEYSAETEKEITRVLEEHGIPYLDLSAEWAERGWPEGYMSTVDHHFTWDGCYDAYLSIMNELKELSGKDFKIYAEDELVRKTVPRPYLGSSSKQFYGEWQSGETIDYAEPVIPVPFRRWENGIEVEPTVYSFPEGDDPVVYAFYMDGDKPDTLIRTYRPELPSILIFGDSFTNPLETILYLSFDEMRAVDLRHYDRLTITQYIELFQPDLVLYVRDLGNSLQPDGNGNLE